MTRRPCCRCSKLSGWRQKVLRYNVTARELIRECLRRERRAAVPGLRGLAERTGIAA
jgi:hypothetical protein